MKRALIPCLILFGALVLSFAQAPQNKTMNTDDPYRQWWLEIDSLEEQGLPRSALDKAEELYSRINREKYPAQSVKCLLYINKYQRDLQEDGVILVIQNLEAEVERSAFPFRPVLQSVLAQLYANYLDDNFWRLNDRTQTDALDESDPQTWPVARFTRRITELYLASVAEERTRQIPVAEWTVLLTDQEGDTDVLRPSLYDLLAHRAIDFFMDQRYFLPEPVYAFYIDDPIYFAPPRQFADLQLTARDSSSFKFLALTLFQQALRQHLHDEMPEAMIDLDLKRLNFVYSHSTLADKEQLYRAALQMHYEAFRDRPLSTEILHKLAQSYYQSGLSYDSQRDTANRWDLKRAHDLCRQGLNSFPDSYGAAHCRQLLSVIERPEFYLRTEEACIPNRPLLALLSFRNTGALHFRLVKLHKLDRLEIVGMQTDELKELLFKQKPLRTWSVNLPSTGDFQKHATEIKIDGLDAGLYAILLSNDPEFKSDGKSQIGYLFTQISQLAYLTQYSSDGQTEFVVVDRAEGRPLEGVLAEFYATQYNRKTRRSDYIYLSNVYTDKMGKAVPRVPDNQYYQVKFSQGEDILFFPDGYSKYGRYITFEEQEVERTAFFLDRQIYRPGQTVYFKGVAYSINKDGRPQIITDRKVTVTLYDVNGQESARLDLRTNEYGSFNGAFQAPSKGLLGAMRLSSSLGNDDFYFRVEEYKRPKFEVTFDTLVADYQLGDTVTATGLAKAYAGSVVDGAKVQYRVVREVLFPWRPWWLWRSFPVRQETMEVQSGELITDEEGKFSIRFPALADPSIDPEQKPLFYFRILADVTDLTGETHSAEKSIRLGPVGLIAEVVLPPQLDRAKDFDATIKTENLEGLFQAVDGKVSVFRVDAPQRILLERYWNKPDMQIMDEAEFVAAFPHFAYGREDEPGQWSRTETVFSAAFNTADTRKVTLPVDQWAVGHYLLELTTADSKGNPISSAYYLWVYDSRTRSLPANQVFWSPETEKPYAPGETFSFLLAGGGPPLHILWGLEKKGVLQREEWAEVRMWEEKPYTVLEEDKGNIFFHYAFVRDNRAYQGQRMVAVPWSEKELQVEFLSFRDKLQPGSDEEWQVKISGAKKEAVAAEVAAAMYDQSLDMFAANTWDFFPHEVQTFPRTRWYIPHFADQQNSQFTYYFESISTPYRRYRELDWSMLSLYRNYVLTEGRSAGIPPPPPPMQLMEMAAPADADLAGRTEVLAKAAKVVSPQPDTVAEERPVPPPPPPSIRKNLEETVFFFPDLRTDAQGNVILRFRMKEALTRWKLLLLAHTKDLATGVATRSVETQKELMVLPNPPRFFREGDEITFTAKVSNLTDDVLRGEARLELFDPLSGAVMTDQLLVSQATANFVAEAHQSAGLEWKLRIPFQGMSVVGHRVIAQSGNFSDGEESVLPVLTNRVLVTETMPITVNGESSAEFTFGAMQKASTSNTLEHKRFSLEFTSNPAWYAVKALPYLMEYPYECTEQIFSRYYANSLAAAVANKHPKIKEVFEDWKKTRALESNLAQNQELKAVLLEETPWVLDAQSEATQRQQIGLLFDLNRMAEEQSVALYKMVESQSSDGGFPWFPGGQDSWFITQYIVEGFGHLQALGVRDIQDNSATREMLRRAVSFIDNEMLLHYVELASRIEAGKTTWDEDHLHALVIHYLYARSFFPEMEMSEEVEKARKYYIDQANRHWLAKGLYEQGLLALAINRSGLKVTPAIIVKSLKERALRDPELGMYWKYDSGFYWYQMPIETHALMVEVFAELDKDPSVVDELRKWLLRNKQTNHWKTTKATAGAVYALLQYGGDWLSGGQNVTIKFEDLRRRTYRDKLEDAQQTAEAGTGYFRLDWSGAEVSPAMSRIAVENNNQNLAWGALYWQYLEEADKVTQFKDTPLAIDKRVFKVVNTDRGPLLQALEPDAELKPGDKLMVRIELRVDRDMEYVHMKDMRASGFEPLNVFSRYQWQGGLGYYESTRDAATHFFFDDLPRGAYVFEYPLRVIHKGDFSNGITTIQCMYAPEYTSHSEGIRLKVD